MTPQQRNDLMDRLPYEPSHNNPLVPDRGVVDNLEKWIDSVIEAAVAEEREACAGLEISVPGIAFRDDTSIQQIVGDSRQAAIVAYRAAIRARSGT